MMAIEAAIAAEDLKRQQALDWQAAQAGETKWVLSFQREPISNAPASMQVVSTGYTLLDAGDAGGDGEEEMPWRSSPVSGRRSYGKPKAGFEARSKRGASPSSDISSVSSGADEDVDEEKSGVKATKRQREVRLKGLASISVGGGNTFGSKDMECFNCGVKGHAKKDCPKKGKKRKFAGLDSILR